MDRVEMKCKAMEEPEAWKWLSGIRLRDSRFRMNCAAEISKVVHQAVTVRSKYKGIKAPHVGSYSKDQGKGRGRFKGKVRNFGED